MHRNPQFFIQAQTINVVVDLVAKIESWVRSLVSAQRARARLQILFTLRQWITQHSFNFYFRNELTRKRSSIERLPRHLGRRLKFIDTQFIDASDNDSVEEESGSSDDEDEADDEQQGPQPLSLFLSHDETEEWFEPPRVVTREAIHYVTDSNMVPIAECKKPLFVCFS